MQTRRAPHTDLSFTSTELLSAIDRNINYINAVLKDCNLGADVMRDIRDRHQQIKTLATIRTLCDAGTGEFEVGT